jgi:hypothetical protein
MPLQMPPQLWLEELKKSYTNLSPAMEEKRQKTRNSSPRKSRNTFFLFLRISTFTQKIKITFLCLKFTDHPEKNNKLPFSCSVRAKLICGSIPSSIWMQNKLHADQNIHMPPSPSPLK